MKQLGCSQDIWFVQSVACVRLTVDVLLLDVHLHPIMHQYVDSNHIVGKRNIMLLTVLQRLLQLASESIESTCMPLLECYWIVFIEESIFTK